MKSIPTGYGLFSHAFAGRVHAGPMNVGHADVGHADVGLVKVGLAAGSGAVFLAMYVRTLAVSGVDLLGRLAFRNLGAALLLQSVQVDPTQMFQVMP